MQTQITRRSFALCLVIMFTLVGFLVLQQNSLAQDQERPLRAGEKFEVGGGQSVEILRCRGEGRDRECEVQYYRANGPEGGPMWQAEGPLLAAQARVTAARRAEAATPAPAGDQPAPAAGDDDAAKTPDDKPAAPEDCASNVPAGDSSKTAKASAELFKRKIYYIYNVLANGTGSAPLSVGVTFLNFDVGQPFTNIVRVDPVTGAHRINDAAPVNATIYPVRSKHIVCEQYRDGLQRRQVENKYNCFKNRDGEWVCGADGIPKVIQLN
jgi:hypothetical protein